MRTHQLFLMMLSCVLSSCEHGAHADFDMYLNVCIADVQIVPSWKVDSADVNASSLVRLTLVGRTVDWEKVCCNEGYSIYWVYHGEVFESIDFFDMSNLVDDETIPEVKVMDSVYFYVIRIPLSQELNVNVSDSGIVLVDRSEFYLPIYMYDSSSYTRFWKDSLRPEVGFWLCDSTGKFLQKITPCDDLPLL